MRSRWLAALLSSVVLSTACAAPPGAADSDAGALDAFDVAVLDGSGDSDAADARPDRDPDAIGPVVDASDPQPLAVPEWMVADQPTPSTDGVRTAVESGSFTLPAMGMQYGVDWSGVVTGGNGEIGAGPRNGYLYGAARVQVPAGRRLFAMVEPAQGIYSNGALQPGDLYASGRIRVPLATSMNTATLLVRGLGGRGNVRVRVFSTVDEVYFNSDDATLPDPVAGQSQELWIGIPVLNLTPAPLRNLTARVEQNAQFEATSVQLPSIAPWSVTQVAFQLRPRMPYPAAMQRIAVALRVESPSLEQTYRREIQLETVAAGTPYRLSRRSAVDGSVQYAGVLPPANFDPMRDYALVLSLHGASVEASGQVRAYSARDWNYVVAPTNRRPFGFDWEEWGRLDAIEALDFAQRTFRIARDQVYLVGHSMGGHGTWHVGLLNPGRFATLGPSAGWQSFVTYTGATHPRAAYGRAQQASVTLDWISNLARRGAYVIHGSGDTNVPVREGRDMVAAARMVTMDVQYHEEFGAAHWWDGMAAPGADCVDWPPLFAFMQSHRLDPEELVFSFVTPSPWVSATHSYVTVQSETDAYQNVSITSARSGDTVTLTTTNVRSMTLDGRMLRAHGVLRITIDGAAQDVADAAMNIGPQTGKLARLHGPMNQVFHRPFCFVYPDAGPAAFQQYVSYLTSTWAVQGNGQACALPLSALNPEVTQNYNLVYVGIADTLVGLPATIPFRWTNAMITLADVNYDAAALGLVYPAAGRLRAVLTTTAGHESLLYRYQPFTSRAGAPDYFVFGAAGGRASGFFDPSWTYVAGR